MSEISSFRFWCQKVLPAVYDDSLSYYELLCKVVTKLNEVINSQNGTNDHVTELAQQFEQLKNNLQDTIESEAEKVVDNYVKSNNLVKSINGITAVGANGEVTLQASDVGAIANVNDSVKENNIKDGSVTSGKIATGAVGSEKISQDAVTASKLANGSVATAKIQNGAVTAEKLAQDAVPVKSVNGKTGEVQITAEEIGALPNTAGSVGATNLQDGAVTGDKIADGSITDSKVQLNSISGDKIKSKSITQGNIANNAVGTDQISKKGIMTENLADTIITEHKLAAGSVTNEKIADGTLSIGKFANQGAENAGKLLKIDSTGKVVLGSGAGQVTAGVESVNGKDGAVILTAKDVGAIPNSPSSVGSGNLSNYIDPNLLTWLKATYPNASADAPVYFNSTPLTNDLQFDGSKVLFHYNESLIFRKQLNFSLCGLPNNKALILSSGILNTSDFVKSINKKSGAVNLTVDDIKGALREVAPSNMLTGESVVGTYLFLAPANGKTDAFQKVDKLPEKMLPTDIDGSLLKDGTIGTGKLVGLSVTTEKIGNNAVTEAKMDANSVSTACIKDGAVTLAKLNQPGAAESGKVLGVSAAGQWELQTPSGGGGWEEIPATSLIDKATVHCRIQPGTGWLWFSIDSDTNIIVGGASSESATSAYRIWGTINVNVCNSPVPTNGTSASRDTYTWERNGLHMSKVSSAYINGTTVKKITAFSATPLSNLTPILRVARNNTGVTEFGLSNTGTSSVSANHAEFYVNYWFDNRTHDDTEAYPTV